MGSKSTKDKPKIQDVPKTNKKDQQEKKQLSKKDKIDVEQIMDSQAKREMSKSAFVSMDPLIDKFQLQNPSATTRDLISTSEIAIYIRDFSSGMTYMNSYSRYKHNDSGLACKYVKATARYYQFEEEIKLFKADSLDQVMIEGPANFFDTGMTLEYFQGPLKAGCIYLVPGQDGSKDSNSTEKKEINRAIIMSAGEQDISNK